MLVLLIVAFAAGPIAVITMVNRPPVTTAGGTTSAALHPVETVINVESERVFNDLRSQYLDDRAEVITWWLMAAAVSLAFITVVVTALGIMIVIGGFVGYGWFRDILTDARRYTENARDNATEAANRAGQIRGIHEQVRERSDEIQDLLKADVDHAPTVDAAEYEQEVEKVDQSVTEGTSVNQEVEKARRLQREGNDTAAIEMWRSIARSQEGQDDALAARAWGYIGDLRRSAGHNALAISAYDAAVRLNPDDARQYFNRGFANSNLGNHESAIEDFNTVIRLDSAITRVYFHRGYAKTEVGNFEGAISDYTTALAYEPEEPRAYLNRGVARARSGHDESAVSDYTAAITINPQYALAYHNRGISRSRLNRDEEAIGDYNESISLNVDNPKVHYSLGLVLMKLQRNPEARAAFVEASNLASQVGDDALQAQIQLSLGQLTD